MERDFSGLGVALVTPFNSSGSIDMPAFIKLADHAINGGVDYLVLFGTTGESPTVSNSEKQEVVSILSNHIKGKKRIVLGFGGNDTAAIVSGIHSFDFTGVSALLSVIPYYNKPNQRGMYEHYKAIAGATELPLILYNVPGRTVVNMEPATTIRIAEECKNVVAIKEATDNLDQVMDLILNKPVHLQVICGDDALALPFIALGADGVISVISNAFPMDFSNLVHAALKGDFNQARASHYKLLPLMHTLLNCGNPSGIKAAVSIIGLINNQFRLPVAAVDEQKFEMIKNEVKKLLI